MFLEGHAKINFEFVVYIFFNFFISFIRHKRSVPRMFEFNVSFRRILCFLLEYILLELRKQFKFEIECPLYNNKNLRVDPCRFWWFFTSSFKLGSIFVNWWLRLLYVAFLILNLFSFFPDLQLDCILLIKLYFLVRNLGNQQPGSFCHILRTVADAQSVASGCC